MAKSEPKTPAVTDPEHACQARTGTDEQQDPNRTPGGAEAAKKALAADQAAAVKAEAAGETETEAEAEGE